MECYKIAILYFHAYGHTKYAFAVVKLFYKIKLLPDEAHKLIWERFINTKGIPGKNIPLDLHMEHLNNFLKELLKNLRSNLNEENAGQIAKAMNNIKLLVENTEDQLRIPTNQSGNNKVDMIKSVRHLATELSKHNPFL